MIVSGSATYEALCSLASQASSYQSALESMRSSYISSVESAQSSLDGLSLSGWNDPISQKFELFLSELRNGLNAISDDLASGGFNSLITIMGQVVSGLNGAKGTALEIRVAKTELHRTDPKIPNPDQRRSDQTGTGTTAPAYINNPKYIYWNNRLSELKTTLESQAGDITALLSQLESVTFGSSLSSSTAGASVDAVSGADPGVDPDVAAAEAAAAEAAAAETAVNSGKADYFIQRGDTCNIHGQTAQFYGQNGKYNYYNVDGMIYYDNGGSLVEVCAESMFNINYLQDQYGGWYGAVNTSNSGAASMGLPSADNVTSCNADYQTNGMAEYVNYSSMDHSDPVVFETTNQYRSALYSPNPPALFEVSDLENANWRVGWSHGTAPKPTNDGKVTFAYDDRSGLYYQLDNNGNYIRNMYGMTPEEMAECYVIPNS